MYINYIKIKVIRMKIHESGENYLKAIHILNNRIGNCRAIDISHYLGFSKPTVSVMLKNLREADYIDIDGNGYITLRTKGEEVADKIYEKHVLIAKFFISLGVNEDTAYQDSCKIEHDISDESFNKIKEFLNKQKSK